VNLAVEHDWRPSTARRPSPTEHHVGNRRESLRVGVGGDGPPLVGLPAPETDAQVERQFESRVVRTSRALESDPEEPTD